MAKGTSLVKWDEELARRAVVAKGLEDSVALGNFLSIRAGVMTYNGNPIEANKMKVVILSHILENKFYDKKFDPDSPASPVCYAFGTVDANLAPHEKAPDPQSTKCADCQHNEWGSSSRGRGKACKNVRRLALLHADSLKEKDGVQNGTVIYLELPVTSVKGWASYVQGLAAVKKRPPSAVITEVSCAPDPKTQVKVSFKFIEDLTPAVLGGVMARADQIEKQIAFPYPVMDEGEERKGRRSAKRGAAKPKKPASRF